MKKHLSNQSYVYFHEAFVGLKWNLREIVRSSFEFITLHIPLYNLLYHTFTFLTQRIPSLSFTTFKNPFQQLQIAWVMLEYEKCVVYIFSIILITKNTLITIGETFINHNVKHLRNYRCFHASSPFMTLLWKHFHINTTLMRHLLGFN